MGWLKDWKDYNEGYEEGRRSAAYSQGYEAGKKAAGKKATIKVITIPYYTHTISLHWNLLSGSSKVYYDNNLKLEGGGFFSAIRQSFFVKEDNENVEYRIEERVSFLSNHFTILRNGVPIYDC